MVKGTENLAMYSMICGRTNFVLTFSILKLLGREIALQQWTEYSKRIHWAACCLAFFGSFRLGEILSPSKKNYTFETLR